MRYGDQVNLLNTTAIICKFISVLPVQFHNKWNKNTLQIRRLYEKKLQLKDLVNFVEVEMTLVKDQLLLRDAVSQYIDKVTATKSR